MNLNLADKKILVTGGAGFLGKFVVEKLLTRSKSPTLASRRSLISALGDNHTAQKLITIAENYTERRGGYTRIVKMVQRKGDAAHMALIEFI